jgi:hypothetical protein
LFLDDAVFCGRWTKSVADAIGVDGASTKVPATFNTYGLVADCSGLSVWFGSLDPHKVLSVPWNEVSEISAGVEQVGRRKLTTIQIFRPQSTTPIGFAVSGSASSLGIPGRREASHLLEVLRRHPGFVAHATEYLERPGS